MVGDKGTDRAAVMGNSIRMVMKYKSHVRKRKANQQKANKLSVHRPNNLPAGWGK